MRGKSDIPPTSIAQGPVKFAHSYVMIPQRFEFLCPYTGIGLADLPRI